MPKDIEKSLSDEATFAGSSKRRAVDASLGDERTLGDGLVGQDTVIDDMEVVDLALRYRIEGTLGRGGMGEVLLAVDTRLDRNVAIKRILGDASRSQTAVSRFLTEAKSIAALNHPNIVQIYDYGRAKDGPFLIMEYVDGCSLLDRCRGSALPLEKAIDLACQMCDGLAKAHDLGIIHRDIKPANVLLTKDGIPKLTDFGLAKAQANDHGQTMTGAVLGTPDFMPPEQRKDASLVDARSDLWSLAATVYQMVTGKSPKIIRFDLLPAELTTVLGKALEDAQDDRYQTARDFRDALRGTQPSVGAAIAIGEGLAEGQCRACRTMNTDLGRKFCRKCGVALRLPCLSCDLQIPVWDTICGDCGANQPATLAERQATLMAQREAAESSLREYAYDFAISTGESMAALAHPMLANFAEWGRAFAATAEAERDRQTVAVAERLAEARKHREAFDYPSAIHVLETILIPLRLGEADALLAECVACRDESVGLLRMIASRIKTRELEGLVTPVERAIALRGDRADLPTLRRQLLVRRDSRISQARQALEAGNAKAAAVALSGVSRADCGGESLALLDRVQTAAGLEDRLTAIVKDAKADGSVSASEAVAILGAARACLAANPANDKVRTLILQCEEIVSPPVLKNSIGMELKLIPVGKFQMGESGSAVAVTLTRPFWLGKAKVTRGQWGAVMGTKPWGSSRGTSGTDLPATDVSWDDATEFCKKLTQRERGSGTLAANEAYRLPTEAEWEYACRAGTTTAFSFGNDESQLGDFGWFNGNSGGAVHAVGTKQANPWGLYDMHGNVWEWCSDWFSDKLAGGADPVGPEGGSRRVDRGGSWRSGPVGCRSAYRFNFDPSLRIGYLGFRVARSQSVQ